MSRKMVHSYQNTEPQLTITISLRGLGIHRARLTTQPLESKSGNNEGYSTHKRDGSDQWPRTRGQTNFNEDWGVQHKIQGDLRKLEEAIKQGTAIVVSNGSFQDQHGAVAWTNKVLLNNTVWSDMAKHPELHRTKAPTGVNYLDCGASYAH